MLQFQIIRATGILSLLIVTGCSSVQDSDTDATTIMEADEDQVAEHEAAEIGTISQPLTGTPNTKVCSCSTGSQWRDTVVVPDPWTRVSCKDFCSDLGATLVQVGCFLETDGNNGVAPPGPLPNSTKFSLGSAAAVSQTPPAPTLRNCGWTI